MRLIDADKAINAIHYEYDSCCNIDESGSAIADDIERIIDNVSPEQQWIPVTEESVIQAGYEGKEIRFRLRGRLFAIRELAQ